MGDGRAEGGHDSIADELVDLAAIVADRFVEDFEATVDGRDELFRRQHLGQASEAADIGEQNSDRTQVAFNRGEVTHGARLASDVMLQSCRRQRWTLTEDGLVPNNGVPANLVPANLVPTDLVPANLVPANLVPTDLVPADLVPTDLVPTDLVPTDLIPADLV